MNRTPSTFNRTLVPYRKPEPAPALRSWWIASTTESREAWNARAQQEAHRMEGSREARSLGYRKAIQDVSPSRVG